MLQEGYQRVVALSGPSAVGKTPLIGAIKEFYPGIEHYLAPVIKVRPNGVRPDEMHLSGDPRYFRSTEEIKALSHDPRYLVHETGDNGYPHAMDLDEISSSDGLVIVETCPTLVSDLKDLPKDPYGLDIVSVFLSPLLIEDIDHLTGSGFNLEQHIYELMKGKLKHRTKYHGRNPEDSEISVDNLNRAVSAYDDLLHAHKYNHVLVNRDGEGHTNWNREPNGKFTSIPVGDALKVMETFAEILMTGSTTNSEFWPSSLILR